jgi:hypothetical protein
MGRRNALSALTNLATSAPNCAAVHRTGIVHDLSAILSQPVAAQQPPIHGDNSPSMQTNPGGIPADMGLQLAAAALLSKLAPLPKQGELTLF